MTVWLIWVDIPKLEAKELLGIYSSQALAVKDLKEYQKKFPLTALKFRLQEHEVQQDDTIKRTTNNRRERGDGEAGTTDKANGAEERRDTLRRGKDVDGSAGPKDANF